MGKWAKSLFGREKFHRVGILLAGTRHPALEKKLLAQFDKVLSSKHSAVDGHLLKKGKNAHAVVSNVYGGPSVMDALALMHDGGCRTVIFIGYAYAGFKKPLEVGSFTVPTKSYHFDGIYSSLDPSRTMATPNRDLKAKLKQVLAKAGIPFVEGPNVSVPSVTFQPPHYNEHYKKINPLTLEMELAAFLSRTKDLGMRGAAVLVISDNKKSSIAHKKELRRQGKLQAFKAIVKNLKKFDLSPLKTKHTFTIDKHLASIIEDPEDVTNVYRK